VDHAASFIACGAGFAGTRFYVENGEITAGMFKRLLGLTDAPALQRLLVFGNRSTNPSLQR